MLNLLYECLPHIFLPPFFLSSSSLPSFLSPSLPPLTFSLSLDFSLTFFFFSFKTEDVKAFPKFYHKSPGSLRAQILTNMSSVLVVDKISIFQVLHKICSFGLQLSLQAVYNYTCLLILSNSRCKRATSIN